MKKYFAVAILPLLASCSSIPSKSAFSNISDRPSQDAADYAETNLHKGIGYPNSVIDQSATSSLDVTEDSAGLVSGLGTKHLRKYSNISLRSASRGNHIVRKEGTRYAETVYDINDNATDLVHDEAIAYSGFAHNGYERTMRAGGTLVCGTMSTYSNTMESATRGLFGGLLRCVVRSTKPYMVGSLNETVTDDTMPGSGWRKRMPDLSGYQPVPAATSGKEVYTSGK